MIDAVPVPVGGGVVFVTLVRVTYIQGTADTYVLVLGFASGHEAARLRNDEPRRIVAGMTLRDGEGVLHEALGDRQSSGALLQAIARRRVLSGTRGDLVGVAGRAFRRVRGTGPLEPVPLGVEQSNTSVVFGDRLILKVFRRVEPGPNPELETGRFLTESARFAHVAAVVGALDYRPRRGEPVSLGILQECVPNHGDAWTYTLDALGRYYERRMATPGDLEAPPLPAGPLVELARVPIPLSARARIGPYLGDARLLGRRSGELHLALASEVDDPAFAPEAFTASYQRSLCQSTRSLTERNLSLLRRRLPALSPEARQTANELIARRGELLERLQAMAGRTTTALRTRVHGDYHLGQVLRTAGDFVIIDFEGEPAVSLSARRVKHSPLKDVAGMVRSFHYAAHHGLHDLEARRALRPEERVALGPWGNYWYVWTAAAFLDGYLATAGDAAFLPRNGSELDALLRVYLLEKAVYELGYELNNRPEWVHLPLAGIHQLLAAGQ